MRPLTITRPKPMIEVLGKPLLHHIIDSLPAAIDELVIVIGYKGDQIRTYFGTVFEGRKVTYIVQEKPLGTGHALHLTKHLFAPGEKFLFMLADDLHSPAAIKRLVDRGVGILVQEHPNPERFGVVEVDEHDRVIGIEEKPAQPRTNLVAIGVYVFDTSFFDYPIPLSPRGEYEYDDPFRIMIKKQDVFVERTDFWHPIGYPQDVEAAQARLSTAPHKLSTPVIILAGGAGTRLGETTVPKALVEVAGKPILEHQLERAYAQGCTDITLALGYKAAEIIAWLKKSPYKDVKCSVEDKPLGTGGALKKATAGLTQPCIVINCDDLADVSYAALVRHAGEHFNVLTGTQVGDAGPFGLLECDEFKKICRFTEKAPEVHSGLVSIGHYYLRPEVVQALPEVCSLEHDLFPRLAAEGKLVLYTHTGNYWFGCGTPETLQQTREYFSKTIL